MALGDILGGFAGGFGQGLSDVAGISLEEEIRKKGEARKMVMENAAREKKKKESLASIASLVGAEVGDSDLVTMNNIWKTAPKVGAKVTVGSDGNFALDRMTPEEQAFYALQQKEGGIPRENLIKLVGGTETESDVLGRLMGTEQSGGDSGTALADEQQPQPFKPSGPGVVQRARDFFGGGSTIIGKTTDRTPDVWMSQIIPILKPGEGISELWEDFQEEFPSISFKQFAQLLKNQPFNPLLHSKREERPKPTFKQQIETLFGVNPKHLKYP